MTTPRDTNSGMRYAGLATQWMVMLSLAVWAGMKLDHLLNWKIPVFLIILPLAALCMSLWQLIKEFNKPRK
ncbi:MAG: ATPase F0F1 [Bacteroidota bacterium]